VGTVTAVADIFTARKRSEVMARVRSRDTRPELAVRRVLSVGGYRYRLHRADLPGRPDIVIPRLRLAIFVHGCFWHHHRGCRKATFPRTNAAFWAEKITANALRDRRSRRKLSAMDWRVLVIWECQTRDVERLSRRLRSLAA
jgi:DNA mismatch endonuclease (patch repair protein)